MPLFLHTRFPKPVQISSLGQEPVLLLRSWNKWCNTWKSHILAGLWLYYLETSLFISVYQTAVGIVSPVEFASEASHFHYKLWENHDLTVQSVITYIYLCG
jgi:hypothetical protein